MSPAPDWPRPGWISPTWPSRPGLVGGCEPSSWPVDGELSDGRARLAREDAETLDSWADNALVRPLRGTNAITTNQRARDSLAAVLASRR